MRIVSFDLILELGIVLLLQRLRLIIRERSIAVGGLHVLVIGTRLDSARVVLLFVPIATVFETHLLLLVHSICTLIAIEIKLDSAIDEVLLSSLVILHLVVVDHVPEQRRFLMAAQKIAL